jgi:hypothetical protein
MIKTMALFAVFLFLETSASRAAPESEFYFGSWDASSEAGMSTIGDMQISAGSINWSGSRASPPCRATYKLVGRTAGTTKYPDEESPRSEMTNNYPYETVKIRLGKADCFGEIAYLRFAVRTDDAAYLEVVRYDSVNKPTGWFGFYRSGRYVCAGHPVEVVHSIHDLPKEIQSQLGYGRSGSDGVVDSDAKSNATDPNRPMRRFNWAAMNSDCIFAVIERGGSQDPFEVDDFRHAPERWISYGPSFFRTAPGIGDFMGGVK